MQNKRDAECCAPNTRQTSNVPGLRKTDSTDGLRPDATWNNIE